MKSPFLSRPGGDMTTGPVPPLWPVTNAGRLPSNDKGRGEPPAQTSRGFHSLFTIFPIFHACCLISSSLASSAGASAKYSLIKSSASSASGSPSSSRSHPCRASHSSNRFCAAVTGSPKNSPLFPVVADEPAVELGHAHPRFPAFTDTNHPAIYHRSGVFGRRERRAACFHAFAAPHASEG